jgi:hypothetical protein
MRDGSSRQGLLPPLTHSYQAGARLMTLTTEEKRARKSEYDHKYRAKNLEKIRQYKHDYDDAHRAEISIKGKQYYQENKQKIDARHRLYIEKNKEKVYAWRREYGRSEKMRTYYREYAREWNKKNPEYAKNMMRRLREAQAGRPKPEFCEICGTSERPIQFDHCHQRGTFRGWICNKCNHVLGIINDNPSWLWKLIEYLDRTR